MVSAMSGSEQCPICGKNIEYLHNWQDGYLISKDGRCENDCYSFNFSTGTFRVVVGNHVSIWHSVDGYNHILGVKSEIDNIIQSKISIGV